MTESASHTRFLWDAWAGMDSVPRAGACAGRGIIRGRIEDFRVEEIPLQEPEGEGEHLWLWVEKRGENTEAVAKQLARTAGVRFVDVGYAGRKDRHAVTRQWFSVHLPGRSDPPLERFENDQLQVLRSERHTRKLRVGALTGNRFRLCVRELDVDAALLERRLRALEEQGVPNYFGQQRFGRAGSNLSAALRLFDGARERDRKRRGFYLSAARSALFNGILARRVVEGNWNAILAGEALVLDGSNSYFVADAIDGELTRRLIERDVHPSGALWGKGEPPCRLEAGRVEREVAASALALSEGLAAAGLRQERRALRLCPASLEWSIDKERKVLDLGFSLPAGAFATSVLREVLAYRDAAGEFTA